MKGENVMRIRDKATDFLMIIGLTISFLVVIYGIGIYNMAISSTLVGEKTKYKNEYTFSLEYLSSPVENSGIAETDREEKYCEEAKKLLSILDVDTGNMSICWGGIAGQSLLPSEGWIYIEMNEEPKKKLEWGRYPTKEELNQNVPVIVVNNAMLDYCEKSGETYYLNVYGNEYEVIGILDDSYQSFTAGETIMFYECLGEKTKEVFHLDIYNCTSFDGKDFKYESDNDIEKQYNEIKRLVQENNMDISPIVPEVEEDWFAETVVILKSIFGTLIFALSLVNCCSISFLWIRHRMNEYSVRKAFGYSTWKLFIHIVKEFVPLAVVSVVLTAVVQLVNIFAFGGKGIYVDNIPALSVALLLTVVLSMIVPFNIVSKVKPATGIKEL